jgi:hypothetical protein
MPFVIIPPMVKIALGLVGAGAVVHWVVKEMRRMNAEVERAEVEAIDRAARQALPTLRRDPRTGDWRVS